MKKNKKILLIIASFFLGMAVGAFVKYQYESRAFKPYNWGASGYGPIIANCYGKDFSEPQMIRAIDYWTIRGHNIGFYEHNPPKSICENGWADGFILLKKDLSLEANTLAVTRRMTIGTTIRGAVIRYQPGSFNLALINEHELGHALGYNHLEEKGHIMHPDYHKMGDGFWAPKK